VSRECPQCAQLQADVDDLRVTSQECRDRVVRHLTGRGWVPIAELAAWMAEALGLTRTQGDADLRTLVLTGRLDRRATGPGWVRAYEYRAVTRRSP
jgi:hypothetical protein